MTYQTVGKIVCVCVCVCVCLTEYYKAAERTEFLIVGQLKCGWVCYKTTDHTDHTFGRVKCG